MIGVLGDGGFFFKNPHLHIWFEEVWIVLDILGDNLGYGGPPPYSASALSGGLLVTIISLELVKLTNCLTQRWSPYVAFREHQV